MATTPSIINFVAPFDPTVYTEISGAQILQFLSGATLYADKGLVIATDDNPDGSSNPPDVVTVPAWKNFLWRRVCATGVGMYVYSDYANDWVTITLAGIAQNSITGGPVGKIALNTITDANIANGALQWSKVVNAPNFVSINDIINIGDLAGSVYGSAVVKAGAISTGKIFDGAVTLDKLAAASIDESKIVPSVSAFYLLRTNATADGVEWFQPPDIFQGACGLGLTGGKTSSLAGNGGKFIRVNAGETAVEFASPNAGAIVGASRNLLSASGAAAISVGGTPSSATLTRVIADSIVMKDATGIPITAAFTAGYSININQTAAALLGPDGAVTYHANTKPNSGWYYIWAISTGSVVSFMFSPSATAVTVGAFSSYIYSAMVGVIRITNDGTGVAGTHVSLTSMYQQDRTVNLLNSDTSAAYATHATPGTGISIGTLGISPIAKSVRIVTQNTGGTGYATALVSLYDNGIGKLGLCSGVGGGVHDIPFISDVYIISSGVSTTGTFSTSRFTF